MMKLFFYAIVITLAINFLLNGQSSEQLKMEAQKQMQFGKYGEAIDLLNKYISANPQKVDGYNLRGLCYERRADYKNAVYDFRSARKIDSNNKEVITNLSRTTEAWYALLYNKIEGHNREIAINPNKPKNYLEIGKSYKNLGDWEKAEEWYDKYLAREEASADEIIRYTEILAKNNHITKGLPILKLYTEKYPNDHRLWSRYGYFLLWSGQNRNAITAFQNALVIRPFFREAQDGLDQALGKGYVYTVNDTSTRHNYGLPTAGAEFPIDRYYRMLRQNYKDNDTRLKLIKELIKAERMEEAFTELTILEKQSDKYPEFENLFAQVTEFRDKVYAERVITYLARLDQNSGDREAVVKLSEYYNYLEDYDQAADILYTYLLSNPDDKDVRMRYAKSSAWNRDFYTAMDEVNILLLGDPNNKAYQFLSAQLSVWTGENLDTAEDYLNNVITAEPHNIEALISMGSLQLQKQNFNLAGEYIEKISSLNPDHPNLDRLKSDMEFQMLRLEEERLFAILEE
jgi:Flp pilus assembly protein TadD